MITLGEVKRVECWVECGNAVIWQIDGSAAVGGGVVWMVCMWHHLVVRQPLERSMCVFVNDTVIIYAV
jgi:hypothetical protein